MNDDIMGKVLHLGKFPKPAPLTARDVLKAQIMRSMLDTDGVVNISVDSTKPGVEVPVHLNAGQTLQLNLSWRFAPGDLALDPDAVHVTLSFNGVPRPVRLPWPAIWRMGDFVFIQDAPTKEQA